jgi:NTP pyrophosphatase (non-canonical NTP hydrolase)
MTKSRIQADPDTQHICQDCGNVCSGSELDQIMALEERLCAGDDTPSGQCTLCGALTYALRPGETPEIFQMPVLKLSSVEVQRALLAHTKYHGVNAVEAAYKMLSEEVGELLVAMNHHRRGRADEMKVCEEIADVLLLLRMLAYLFSKEMQIEDIMDDKARHVEDRFLGQERISQQAHQPPSRDELAELLRNSFHELIVEADEWRPLAEHVLYMIRKSGPG